METEEELKKARSIIKRLIIAERREGWEDTETFSKVRDDANDFLFNFEFYEELEPSTLKKEQ